jgi:hypothetical protein
MRHLFTLGLLCLGLAACGTTQVAMPYTPAVPPVAQPGAIPVIAVGSVLDRRNDGREAPNWIGTMRDGFGIPMKRIDAPVPVTQVVKQAFTDGLAARGLLAAGAPRYLMNIEIQEFSSNQYKRREATADFRVSLVRNPDGTPIYADQEKAYQVDGSVLSLATGVFASRDDLQAIAIRTMSEAVDRILDKPRLVSAAR